MVSQGLSRLWRGMKRDFLKKFLGFLHITSKRIEYLQAFTKKKNGFLSSKNIYKTLNKWAIILNKPQNQN